MGARSESKGAGQDHGTDTSACKSTPIAGPAKMLAAGTFARPTTAMLPASSLTASLPTAVESVLPFPIHTGFTLSGYQFVATSVLSKPDVLLLNLSGLDS